jgi:hypothetical protein
MQGEDHARGLGVVLCADIFHTQGASLYAFASFLAIAIRATRELGVPVEVQLPEAAPAGPHGFGYGLDALYTAASLRSLASVGGFTWRRQALPHICSFTMW